MAFYSFSFVYQDEISIIQDMTDWKHHQDTLKGEKDFIFMYFKGLGSLGIYLTLSIL